MKGILNLNGKLGQLLNKFGQCLLLSVYWLLFSLPVFTWGAAACALYSTGRKLIDDEEGKLFQTFKASFKQNFKQGAIVGTVALLACLVAIYCGLLMLRMGVFTDTLGTVTGVVYLLVVIAGLVWLHFILAYIARFEDNLKTVVRNTVYMALMHLRTSIRLCIQLVIFGALFYFLNIIPYLPAIVMLLPCTYGMLTIGPLERVFLQYIPKEEPEEELPSNEETTEK